MPLTGPNFQISIPPWAKSFLWILYQLFFHLHPQIPEKIAIHFANKACKSMNFDLSQNQTEWPQYKIKNMCIICTKIWTSPVNFITFHLVVPEKSIATHATRLRKNGRHRTPPSSYKLTGSLKMRICASMRHIRQCLCMGMSTSGDSVLRSGCGMVPIC